MVRRPSRCLGIDTDEPELRQIQLVDEDVDHANRIILANPIFQAFRKERALSAIRAFNEALHQIPPRIRAGIITRKSLLSERFYTAWVMERRTRREHFSSAGPRYRNCSVRWDGSGSCQVQ